LFSDAIGEESELADANEAGRQDVKQEAAEELDRVQAHVGGSIAVLIVLPVEADAVVFERAKPVVGEATRWV